jgi:hypothetical protein
MKGHLLWFAGFLIAVGTFIVSFRAYEDRHRFVLIRADIIGRFDVGYKTASRLPCHRWRYPADNQTMTFCR